MTEGRNRHAADRKGGRDRRQPTPLTSPMTTCSAGRKSADRRAAGCWCHSAAATGSAEAMILSLASGGAGKPLKAVRSLLDEEPVITERELRLALWMTRPVLLHIL